MAKKAYGWTPSPLFAKLTGAAGGYSMQKKPFKKNLEAHIRHSHKPKTDMLPVGKCPCQAFRLCDQYYSDMTEEEQLPWIQAMKKTNLSGYTLFMKECLCTMNKFGTFPVLPTESGGFSCQYVTGDGPAPDETIGLFEPPPGPSHPCPTAFNGIDCPHCSGTTPDHICASIFGAEPPPLGPDDTYWVRQDTACSYRDPFEHIGELSCTLVDTGREALDFTVEIIVEGETLWGWTLREPGVTVNCWDPYVLECFMAPRPPEHPAWDSSCIWHARDYEHFP